MSEEAYFHVLNFSDSFSICVTSAQSWRGAYEDKSARWLGLNFDAIDKEAVFFRALKAFDPAGSVGGRISVEAYHQGKWEKLWKESDRTIELVTANFPLIRRLKEEYKDAAYSPDEIGAFRKECLGALSQTNEADAVAAIDKLIFACDEALKDASGLYFASN